MKKTLFLLIIMLLPPFINETKASYENITRMDNIEMGPSELARAISMLVGSPDEHHLVELNKLLFEYSGMDSSFKDKANDFKVKIGHSPFSQARTFIDRAIDHNNIEGLILLTKVFGPINHDEVNRLIGVNKKNQNEIYLLKVATFLLLNENTRSKDGPLSPGIDEFIQHCIYMMLTSRPYYKNPYLKDIVVLMEKYGIRLDDNNVKYLMDNFSTQELSYKILSLYLENGGNPNIQGKEQTLGTLAAKAGMVELSMQLLDHPDFQLNDKSPRGWTIGMAAAQQGQRAICEKIMAHKDYDPNIIRGCYGTSCSMGSYAAYRGLPDVAFKILLDRADVDPTIIFEPLITNSGLSIPNDAQFNLQNLLKNQLPQMVKSNLDFFEVRRIFEVHPKLVDHLRSKAKELLQKAAKSRNSIFLEVILDQLPFSDFKTYRKFIKFPDNRRDLNWIKYIDKLRDIREATSIAIYRKISLKIKQAKSSQEVLDLLNSDPIREKHNVIIHLLNDNLEHIGDFLKTDERVVLEIKKLIDPFSKGNSLCTTLNMWSEHFQELRLESPKPTCDI